MTQEENFARIAMGMGTELRTPRTGDKVEKPSWLGDQIAQTQHTTIGKRLMSIEAKLDQIMLKL
jgi:hypothetical protein